MRRLTDLYVLIVVACCLASASPALSLDEAQLTSRLWMHLDSRWEKAPPEVEIKEEAASARLVRFLPNGEFSWIGCIVRRSDHQTSISAGDGQVVFMGRWRTTEDGMAVRYVKVYEMVHAIDGSDAPFAKVSEAIVHLNGNELTFEGRKYAADGAKAPAVNEYDSQYIAPLREMHRERLRAYFSE